MNIIKIVKKLSILLVIVIYSFFVKDISAITNFFDPTFGTSGKTITSFGHDASVRSMILQQDGKPLLAGYTSNGINRDWAIVRYDTNGFVDPSFGVNGIVKREFGNDDGATSIAIQEDGKILIGGYSGPGFTWVLARYNSTGNPDIGFGSEGINSISTQGIINSIIILPDDKILAIGYFVGINNGHDDIALVRYNSDGSLDTSFGGGDGKVVIPIGSSNDRGNAAVLQPDGKIVVFGDFAAGGGDDIFLVRFNSDGTLDNTFGSSGKVTTNFEFLDGARDMAFQPDGKIVVTGGTFNGSQSNTFVARYNTNGTLDNTFGSSGGKILTSFSSSNDSSNSIVLQADGKIVLGGYESASSPNEFDFALRRFNSDGTLDTIFGENGSIISPIGLGSDEISDIALQGGKIIAAGNTHNGSYNDWAIARFGESDVDLDVPLLKQYDKPWGNQLFDFSNRWASPTDRSISDWGCAITSAAMVLRYHGITKMPNGQDLDPASLNHWLKSQPDGYVNGGNLWFYVLGRLAEQAKSNNPSFAYDTIEYRRVIGADTSQLTTDLANGIPGILEEANPQHFVVAKGKSAGTFTINDPFHDWTDLTSYSNTFKSLVRLIPRNSDLSYIVLSTNKDISISMEDSSDSSVGEGFIQDPPENDENLGELGGGPFRIFHLPAPDSGDYSIDLSSLSTESYNLDVYFYDLNGEVKIINLSGIVGPSDTDNYSIHFDKDQLNNNLIISSITFDDLISDINSFRDSGDVDSFGTYISLITKAELAKAASLLDKNSSKNILNSIAIEIKAQKGKSLSENAYQILNSNIQSLLASL